MWAEPCVKEVSSAPAGLGFSSSSQWDLMGTAMVTPDYVRLTPDLQSRQGAVWSRVVGPLMKQWLECVRAHTSSTPVTRCWSLISSSLCSCATGS